MLALPYSHHPVFADDASSHLTDDDDLACLSRFDGSDASSATSMDGDSRAGSPTPSLRSITSADMMQAFTEEYGRIINGISDVYKLPADHEELSRLGREHLLFIEIMGKYPHSLPRILQHEDGRPVKQALDIGCGDGSWAMDLAHDFPLCNVIAIDLFPIRPAEMPPNLWIEVDDVNLDMAHYHGQFNVVHARTVSSGIRNYPEFIDKCALMLCPGGLIDLLEIDREVYGINQQPILAPGWTTIEAPYLPRWMHLLDDAVNARGGTSKASRLLEPLIKTHPKFIDMTYRDYFVPLTPWYANIPGIDPADQEVQRQLRIAQVMSENMLELMKSGRPLLLSTDVPEEVVDRLEAGIRVELAEKRTWLIKMRNVYARRSP